MKLDDLFLREHGIKKFEFNANVVEVFDDMVKRSVPFYQTLQECFVRLGKSFAQENSNIYDLGCSTCTTLAYLAAEIPDKNVTFIGYDNSHAMLKKSYEKLEKLGFASKFILQEVNLEEDFEIENASIIFMNWTLQFIRPESRERLLNKIFNGLKKGGIFILSEKVSVDDFNITNLYIDFYHDYKRQQSYTDEEITRKRDALENVLIPMRVDENLQMIRKAGFSTVDVFFRWFNWAGFLAIK